MCTKLEKELAVVCFELISKYNLQGNYTELMPVLEKLKAAEIEEPNERYTYEGLECLKQTPAERAKTFHGLCRVRVKRGSVTILEIFWDSSLQWIMQPDGKRFIPSYNQKLPTGGATRQFLKKLADAEVKEPGSFAKKYYVTRPTTIELDNAPMN
jgi:hypothetical protein